MNAAGKVGIGVGGNFRAGRSGALGYMSSSARRKMIYQHNLIPKRLLTLLHQRIERKNKILLLTDLSGIAEKEEGLAPPRITRKRSSSLRS